MTNKYLRYNRYKKIHESPETKKMRELEGLWRQWGLDIEAKRRDYKRRELDFEVTTSRMRENWEYKESHGIHVFCDPDANWMTRQFYDWETRAIQSGEMEPRHSEFYIGFKNI